MSFETLRQIREYNRAAQQEEQARLADAAESTREGVPVDTWRALRREPPPEPPP